MRLHQTCPFYLKYEILRTSTKMILWGTVLVDSVMSLVNPNTSDILLEEFLSIVRKKKEVQLHWNEIRHIFIAFRDFKKAFRLIVPKLSESSVLDIFMKIARQLDGHCNGNEQL
ncbi:unnamed protein product [Nyctereutes procyonoides]|uniref:(raccoon dog) hypothetical protein n=1 Tax=Nyctereutes procyonoides TaxID=34880 RepID=A0A811YRY8_NYCPR|nr:unnamed protein product [Nyctereutes procyonoides]